MTPAATRRLIEQLSPSAARLGTVTTAGSNPVVAIDGVGSATVYYVADGLTVAVGNRVLLLREAGGAWVLAQRLTTPTAVAPPVVRRVNPVRCWVKGAPLAAGPGSWTSQTEYISLGFTPEVWQGQDTSQSGADGVTTPKALIKYATVLYFGALSTLIPSGATVLDVSIAFARELPANAINQPPLTYPRLYGSLYTTGSAPNSSNPPSAVAGRGPLTPVAAIAPGQSTTIGLPATWVTDYLSGAISSLHFYSDQRSDIIRSLRSAGVQLVVTYLE